MIPTRNISVLQSLVKLKGETHKMSGMEGGWKGVRGPREVEYCIFSGIIDFL